MYTGTLIQQLMAAVERVEKAQIARETAELERLYLAEGGDAAMQYQQNLVGVA